MKKDNAEGSNSENTSAGPADLAIVRGELGKLLINQIAFKESVHALEERVTAVETLLKTLSENMAKESERAGQKEFAALEKQTKDILDQVTLLKGLVKHSPSTPNILQ